MIFDTRKFGSKVINRQLFHRKTVFHMKKLSITNITKKFTRKFDSKVIRRQYFRRRTGLKTPCSKLLFMI